MVGRLAVKLAEELAFGNRAVVVKLSVLFLSAASECAHPASTLLVVRLWLIAAVYTHSKPKADPGAELLPNGMFPNEWASKAVLEVRVAQGGWWGWAS